MFDIGAPEFLVIAIVALVVLGPERLPVVMRQAGRFYRQARQTLNQYTGEAQRMLEEGMREVEDVSKDINSAWQSATSDTDTTAAPPPPPRLLQLPPAVIAPDKAPAAGPWALAAWHGDTQNDVEPRPAESLVGPHALPRNMSVEEPIWDDFTGVGGPSLMGSVPAPWEAAEPAQTVGST